MAVDPLEFGGYIRRLRHAKALTLVDLSKASGVSQPYLSQIENGKAASVPSPDILKKIADPLDVRYEELMLQAGHLTFVDWMMNTEDEADYNKNLDEAYAHIERQGIGLKFNPTDHHLPVKDLSLLIDMPGITWQGKVLSKFDKTRVWAMLDILFLTPKENENE